MEADQTQLFNQKLSQWIASQGFWFQLRHSISGGGGWSMTLHHLVRLGMKVLVALLVASVVFGICLVKRVNSKSFVASLDAGLEKGLSASDAKLIELRRTQGDALIRRLGVEGGADSFFRSMDAGNVRFKMPLMAGISGRWGAGTLQAKWLELDLKAGADSAEHSKRLGDALFRDWPGFDFSSVEVDEASLRWGYTQRAAGRIEKSRMVATRSTEGWRLVFHGGTFSQNWLRQLEIGRLTVEIGRAGLKIVEGDFKCGTGTVTFREVAVSGGEKPQISGKAEFSQVELSRLLPEAATALIEGTVSGELVVTGSTNTAEGVQFEGDFTLSDGSLISLRERIELLKALALADRFNSYRKVDFTRGSFHLKTGGGSMKLSRVDLAAGELMTMQGLLEVRYPTDDELIGPEGTNITTRFSPIFDPKATTEGGKGDEISLRKAAKASTDDAKESEIFYRRAQERIDEQLRQEEMIRRSQALRCSGSMKITIPGEAFDRSATLRKTYPIDPGTGRIAMDVPLDGNLFELTRRQAEEISRLTEVRDGR